MGKIGSCCNKVLFSFANGSFLWDPQKEVREENSDNFPAADKWLELEDQTLLDDAGISDVAWEVQASDATGWLGSCDNDKELLRGTEQGEFREFTEPERLLRGTESSWFWFDCGKVAKGCDVSEEPNDVSPDCDVVLLRVDIWSFCCFKTLSGDKVNGWLDTGNEPPDCIKLLRGTERGALEDAKGFNIADWLFDEVAPDNDKLLRGTDSRLLLDEATERFWEDDDVGWQGRDPPESDKVPREADDEAW